MNRMKGIGSALVYFVVVTSILMIVVARGPGQSTVTPGPGVNAGAVQLATTVPVPSVQTAAGPGTSPSASLAAEACLSVVTTLDRADSSVASELANASTVVVGTVASAGVAMSDTIDGSAPPSPVSRTPLHVFRLVKINIETVAKGHAVGGAAVTVRFLGGRIGCSDYAIAGFPRDMPVGSRFVVLTGRVAGSDAVVDSWPVLPGDLVETPTDGTLSLSTVLGLAQ